MVDLRICTWGTRLVACVALFTLRRQCTRCVIMWIPRIWAKACTHIEVHVCTFDIVWLFFKSRRDMLPSFLLVVACFWIVFPILWKMQSMVKREPGPRYILPHAVFIIHDLLELDLQSIQNWLVVWNMAFIFPYFGNNHYIWAVGIPPIREASSHIQPRLTLKSQEIRMNRHGIFYNSLWPPKCLGEANCGASHDSPRHHF